MGLTPLRSWVDRLGCAFAICMAVEAVAIMAFKLGTLWLFAPGFLLADHLVDDVHGGWAILPVTFVATTLMLLPPVYFILTIIVRRVASKQSW